MNRWTFWPALGLALAVAHSLDTAPAISGPTAISPLKETDDRSPVDLVLTSNEQRLLTANQLSNTLSLVDVGTGKVLDEVPCGRRPSALALTPDERRVLVAGTFGGDVTMFALDGSRLKQLASVHLGFEPRGIAICPDGRRAYVALTTAHAIAVLDLDSLKPIGRIDVGRWPRYLALNPDGSRLAVGANGDGGVAVVDTASLSRLYLEDFAGLNLGQMHISNDGKFVYFPYIVYRANAITPGNIRLGWVLASRLARVRLDGPARREAISLDPQGEAISDPYGVALSRDENWAYCAASGTHELLVYRLPGLPFIDYGGPGDHIDKQLLTDKERFFRIPLGGRPMAVRASRDGQHVYVANALLNAVQVVDPVARKIVKTIALGGPAEPSLARQGEAIFHDGRRSLDQWYSCHSCHYEGHTNAVTMDTRNDGRFGNYKVVLSLRNVTHTGPWTWHGWQNDLTLAMRKSLTDSMQGKEPNDTDIKALIAFLGTLEPPPNPFRKADGSLADAARRGEQVFRGEKSGCARCHGGAYFTDGKIHEVGTGERGDVYKGYNSPSLIGVYDRPNYLHDGRAKSLEELLKGAHNPDHVTGKGELSSTELADLIEYLKSL